MAKAKKRGNSWFIQVRRKVKGVTLSKSGSFPRKNEAEEWAAKTLADMIAGKAGKLPTKTFGELLQRYAEEISAPKPGSRWEKVRIQKILGSLKSKRDPISLVMLEDLDETHVAKWRDRRTSEVTISTVLREWNLLSNVCTVAVREWKWLHTNPFRLVKRPKPPEPRFRRVRDHEIADILFALGYDHSEEPVTKTARVGAAFLFAIETGMRLGEIVNLTWEHVHPMHSHLPKTKNGFRRDVPLSTEALRILSQLDQSKPTCFDLKADTLDAIFRKCRSKALIEDLHFHDTRHEALTRLSKIYPVMALAKIAGIRDVKILQNVYYNPDIEDFTAIMHPNGIREVLSEPELV